MSSISTSSAKFSEFDTGNMILFQINVFGKETMLAKYFIKVAARSSFTRLRVIREIHGNH